MEDERLEELLSLSVGELREMLAYEDAEDTVEKFLADNGWIDADTDDDEDDEYDYEEDEDEEEEDDWDEEDEDYVPGLSNLPSDEEERLAEQIADDIDAKKYRIEDIMGVYSLEFVDRVNYLIG